MTSKALIPVIFIILLILSCATTGPGGKTSLILIPSSQEVAIGNGMAKQVEQTEKVLQDTVWQDYVNSVGQKIVAVCDRRNITYHFTVINSDQINAFATPGGHIFIYIGLLRRMDNEAELAAVLGHEISHVVARHGIKRLQAALGVAAAYRLAFGGDNSSDIINSAVGAGMNLIFSGYSRSNEREADKDGIYYMTKAGYNPQAAVTMFEKLAQLGGKGNSNIFEKLSADHPETEERIKNAKSEIKQTQPLPPHLILGTKYYQKMKKRLLLLKTKGNHPKK
ncbi:MAG: M48 family metalloprotease [FCB group bacterium]|nr:M48 family metalloprotease [FCB group bacterium]